MSCIEKLLIRGIRSFNPNSENVIEFYTPLTIIVGHNGAGKTTIIECLKYAMTGDLPPNSKGGAFVHDPKLVNESEIKAQIKLKFKNVKGQTMVATRSLQISQKKSKLEQKTLESLLVTTDATTGEQVSLSSRVAELDNEIPIQLGVSKSILDMVILCHQEEAFWPLAEPSILKKRFDEIFAATRYTKALDVIKSIRKEMSLELKLEQQRLDHLRLDREKASKITLNIKGSQDTSDTSKKRIKSLDLQIETANCQIRRLNEDLAGLANLGAEMERIQHELRLTEETRESIRLGLQEREMDESDENIHTQLRLLRERASISEEDNLKNIERKKSLENNLKSLQKDHLDLYTQRGILQSQLTVMAERGGRAFQILSDLSNSLDLNFYHHQNVTVSFDNFPLISSSPSTIFMIKNALEGSESTLKKLQNNHKIQLESLEDSLTDFTRQQLLSLESKRIKKKQMDENSKKLSDILTKLLEITSEQEQMDELEERVCLDEICMNSSNKFLEEGNYEQRINNLAMERKQVEGELSILTLQIAQITKQSDRMAKLQLLQNARDKKFEMANRLFEECKSDYFKDDEMEREKKDGIMTLDQIDKESERLLRIKQVELGQIQESFDTLNMSLSICKSKYEQALNLKIKKEYELNEKIKKIQFVCKEEEYRTLMAKVESEYNTIKKEIQFLNASTNVMKVFSEKFEKDHQCPLCIRSFSNKMDEEMFSKRLYRLSLVDSSLSMSSSVSCPLESNELNDLKLREGELDLELNKLANLRPIFDSVERLKMYEIPELSMEIQEIEKSKLLLENEFEDTEQRLTSSKLSERKAVILKKRAEDISRMMREYRLLQNDVSQLELELTMIIQKTDSFAISSSSSSIENLYSRQSVLQEKIKNTQQDHDKISEEFKNRQQDYQIKFTRFRDTKEQLMHLQLNQNNLNNLRIQQNNLEIENSKLQQEINRLQEQASSVESKLLVLNQEKIEYQNKAKDEIDKSKNHLTHLTHLFDNYKELTGEIESGKQKESLKIEIEIKIKDLSEDLKKYSEELELLSNSISLVSKKTGEIQLLERTLLDNLRLRELTKKHSELIGRKQSIGLHLGSFNRIETVKLLDKQQIYLSDLMGERSGLLGEIRQLDDQIIKFKKELDTDYDQVESKWKDQYIKVNANFMVIDDLDKYAKALDGAIMKYHSHKIDEINKIIREIWSGTYQGADIDTIEIRAEHDMTAGNRSYNYRVVMIKGGDIELDMRGRSSAGQRVLASLIIRLALAETFGQHCSLLALDEPTTNLDRENIAAFARALANIIQMRRAQHNYQLIVITHDEEFVEELGRAAESMPGGQTADWYWRVWKDECGFSCIERQSFKETSL